jgi:hypothetical protein
VLDATGVTSSITLTTWSTDDPSNNLTSNSGYTGMGFLEDNSISQGTAVLNPWSFHPYIITNASASYGDTPSGDCTIYALL